jgi:hypothetical protein
MKLGTRKMLPGIMLRSKSFMSMILREIIRFSMWKVYELYYQLHPPPGAAELDPGVILAGGGEFEEESEEEEDPEELELVDESDDEGGHVSRMDTDHED